MSSTGFDASNAQITINQTIDTAENTTTQYALNTADESGIFYGVNSGVLGGIIKADGAVNTIEGSGNTTSVNFVINGAYVTKD